MSGSCAVASGASRRGVWLCAEQRRLEKHVSELIKQHFATVPATVSCLLCSGSARRRAARRAAWWPAKALLAAADTTLSQDGDAVAKRAASRLQLWRSPRSAKWWLMRPVSRLRPEAA